MQLHFLKCAIQLANAHLADRVKVDIINFHAYIATVLIQIIHNQAAFGRHIIVLVIDTFLHGFYNLLTTTRLDTRSDDQRAILAAGDGQALLVWHRVERRNSTRRFDCVALRDAILSAFALSR